MSNEEDGLLISCLEGFLLISVRDTFAEKGTALTPRKTIALQQRVVKGGSESVQNCQEAD